MHAVVESNEFCPFFVIFPTGYGNAQTGKEDMLRVRWAVFALNLASVIFVVRNVSQHVQKRIVLDEEKDGEA